MALPTFNSVSIPSYNISDWKVTGAYVNEITMDCRTPTFSDITSLQALQGHIGTQLMASGKTRIQTTGGTKASLVINGTTYLNCYISALERHEVKGANPFDMWEFTIKFVQETV
jgi:hypothetical protein